MVRSLEYTNMLTKTIVTIALNQTTGQTTGEDIAPPTTLVRGAQAVTDNDGTPPESAAAQYIEEIPTSLPKNDHTDDESSWYEMVIQEKSDPDDSVSPTIEDPLLPQAKQDITSPDEDGTSCSSNDPLHPTTKQILRSLKTFSGLGCVSFPQWKHESLATLKSSRVSRTLWHDILLKNVAAPALMKISQDAALSTEVDWILADLEKYYGSSRVISAAIFQVHMTTGRIPDPLNDWNKSLVALIAHHEALVATEKFLKYSTQVDSEGSIYQFTPVDSLIKLIPDRIRMDKDNTIFRAYDSTSNSVKERYLAFSNWVKEALIQLQAWEVETQVSTMVRQSLSGTSTIPDSSIPTPTSRWTAADSQHLQQTSTADTFTDPEPQKITFCLYCDALSQNPDWTSSEISMKWKAMGGFDATHYQFLVAGQRYILPPTGCLQFLLASPYIRRAAVQTSGVCPICLGTPRHRSPTGACRKKHVIAKKTGGRLSSLCMVAGCEYHQLICLEHEEINKNHPRRKRSDTLVEEMFQKYPQIKAASNNHLPDPANFTQDC